MAAGLAGHPDHSTLTHSFLRHPYEENQDHNEVIKKLK